jgi:hypothetical protein
MFVLTELLRMIFVYPNIESTCEPEDRHHGLFEY